MKIAALKNRRSRYNRAYFIGAIAGLAVVFVLSYPRFDGLHAHGPMNAGHENLQCESCHRPEQGTLRQRLQANMQFLLGTRQAAVAIGHQPVANPACLRCHERANERHPVYRFLEPRYVKVRQAIAPQHCRSCHREHTGKRVTAVQTVCSHCHGTLNIHKDPLQTTHATLVKLEKWESCLGCHDFHGNHKMKTATDLQTAIDKGRIEAYFNGAASPYPKDKYFRAKHDNEN